MPTTSQGHPQLLIDENGKPREECGVFGIIGPENAASLTAFGLHALQHRGQEACGILTFEGTNEQEVPKTRNARGMVSHVFGNRHKLKAMSGNIAVGHVRYATKGPKNDVNAIQPFYTINKSGSFGLAHNGQFTNSLAIRKTAMERNYSFRSNSDSETVVGAISISQKPSMLECIQEGISHMRGAFALVIATPYQLIGIRDPNGIRPLVLGELRDGNGFVLASESCALDIIDAELVRDIVPGEMIIIDKHGHKSHFNCGENARARTCIFEYVYFSRPDSILDGRHIYQARYNMGLQMAEQELAKCTDGLQGDVVISVPDSGNPAAMGFAKGLGLDYQMGVIRNHYVGRSFIEPTQNRREERVRLKHSPNRAVLEGKRIYVVDDSLVRGNTSRTIAKILQRSGALEVHFRISCPQVRHSCIYGIDIPYNKDLLSNTHHGCVGSMRQELNVNSIDFLDLKRLYAALGVHEPRNAKNPQFTDHYFTGTYPVSPEETESAKDDTGQLSLPLEMLA